MGRRTGLIIVLAAVFLAAGGREGVTGNATFIPNPKPQSYYAGSAFSAYTGMWGVHVPHNEDLRFTMSLGIHRATFPAGTAFRWDVTPDPDYRGINGYLHVDYGNYGNYDDSPGSISSRQVYAINDLTVDALWKYRGDPSSGLLCELWLSSTATPAGAFTKTHEVGYFPKMSPASIDFVKRLPPVGAGFYTDTNGVGWDVSRSTSATGQPYFIAYRPSHQDFEGPFLFRDYFRFLLRSGAITGNEWFNGVAFGVEPLSGAASLTIERLDVRYS